MSTYFLSAPDELTLRAALAAAGYEVDGQYGVRFTLSDWTPCENHTPGAKRHDVDVVGVIHKQTGTDVAGLPVFTAQPGFHCNVTAHELHKALALYQIEPPVTPYRAPCASPCTKAQTRVYDDQAKRGAA